MPLSPLWSGVRATIPKKKSLSHLSLLARRLLKTETKLLEYRSTWVPGVQEYQEYQERKKGVSQVKEYHDYRSTTGTGVPESCSKTLVVNRDKATLLSLLNSVLSLSTHGFPDSDKMAATSGQPAAAAPALAACGSALTGLTWPRLAGVWLIRKARHYPSSIIL